MKNNALFFKRRDFEPSGHMLKSIGANDYDKYYDDMSKIQLNIYETIEKY